MQKKKEHTTTTTTTTTITHLLASDYSKHSVKKHTSSTPLLTLWRGSLREKI
jgi:hypothetical protein